jgi:hypothetical protein
MGRLRPGIEFLQAEFRKRRAERFEEFREFWKRNLDEVGWKAFARRLGRNVP